MCRIIEGETDANETWVGGGEARVIFAIGVDGRGTELVTGGTLQGSRAGDFSGSKRAVRREAEP